MLKQKRFWIPILSVLVIAMGCGLFYGRKVANQAPVKVYKPVDVQQPATPKPPPPGETAESGHWHGDEWHAEPHDTHAPAEVSQVDAELATPPAERTEVTGAPVGAPHVGAQSSTPRQESSRTRTPQEEAEIQRQWREWSKWEDKAHELRVKISQAHHAWSDLMPESVEEAERYQTDKEWQRKAQEAADKYDEVLEMMQEHDANRVLPPAQSFRGQTAKE